VTESSLAADVLRLCVVTVEGRWRRMRKTAAECHRSSTCESVKPCKGTAQFDCRFCLPVYS